MLIEAEIWTVAKTEQGNAVLVRPVGAEAAVPIFIGYLEAQSILIGLGNVPMPRPFTHDLFLNVLETAGMSILRVEITSIRENTYYAQLVLQKGEAEVILDSRPSDAMALAVRVKCPLFIEESVVDEAAISLASIQQDEPGKEEASDIAAESAGLSEEEQLRQSLQQHIEKEEYEQAAKIRDKLQELEKRQSEEKPGES